MTKQLSRFNTKQRLKFVNWSIHYLCFSVHRLEFQLTVATQQLNVTKHTGTQIEMHIHVWPVK